MKLATPALRERKTRFIRLLWITPPQTVCPNFYLLAHANGCAFAPLCDYCYLKSSLWYLKRPEAFTNVEEMLQEVREWIAQDDLETYMLNSGNLSDSLSFEPTRPLMARLIDTFRQHAAGRPHTLLLVSKGGMAECASLLEMSPCSNVVISFSVNHPDAARQFERGAAGAEDRLQAAAALKQQGWRVRIRVDPMIWGFDYGDLAQAIRQLAPERVTLGSLRAERNLFKHVSPQLLADLEPADDPNGLARYSIERRLALYGVVVEALRGSTSLGLCEEQPQVWNALGLDTEGKSCNCCV